MTRNNSWQCQRLVSAALLQVPVVSSWTVLLVFLLNTTDVGHLLHEVVREELAAQLLRLLVFQRSANDIHTRLVVPITMVKPQWRTKILHCPGCQKNVCTEAPMDAIANVSAKYHHTSPIGTLSEKGATATLRQSVLGWFNLVTIYNQTWTYSNQQGQ